MILRYIRHLVAREPVAHVESRPARAVETENTCVRRAHPDLSPVILYDRGDLACALVRRPLVSVLVKHVPAASEPESSQVVLQDSLDGNVLPIGKGES